MKLENFPVMIDQFKAGAELYLLTHFHSDHMSGLTKKWARGRLVCSPITGKLLTDVHGLHDKPASDKPASGKPASGKPASGKAEIIALEPGGKACFDTSEGEVKVTAFPANHCPGAVMYLIEAGGESLLHTGDFRINDEIRKIAAGLNGIDTLCIDTTYAKNGYRFPPQEEAIKEVLETVEDNMDKEILVAVYTIGKNRIIEAIHNEFGVKVYMKDKMIKVYEAIGMGHMVTKDYKSTNIKAYSRGYLMKYYPMYGRHRPKQTVVIIPTGWAVDEQEMRGFNYVFVPYSEHCDFVEYSEFIELVSPKRVMEL